MYDNAVLMGGRYNQILYDVTDSATTPTSSFDHNFMAGKQDRGCTLVLDLSLNAHIRNNYFGHRPTGGPSGQTNGWETIRIGNSGIMGSSLFAQIENNYFEYAEGEDETISDKTHDNVIRGNTFNHIRKGWVTGRHGGRGVYENNYFLDALGIRVGNSEDTVADHPGLIIRNNYMEGSNAKILFPGHQTTPIIEGNTVVVTPGTAISSSHTTGKYPLEYTNTTGGTINNNIFVITDNSVAAVQAGTLGGVGPSATGTGNFAFNLGTGTIFSASTPTAIRNLFSPTNPQLVRDANGILRPSSAGSAAGKGYQGTTPVLSRTSDVGPSWMDSVMRMNKFTAADFRFDGRISGVINQTVENDGYISTPATLQNSSGVPANLHSADGSGVSGRLGDRAFDNRATASMGSTTNSGKALVTDRTWFRDLQAFTIAGWFKTDGNQSIGNGAVLMQQMDANGGWSLASTTTGKLTLTIDSGGSAKTATSATSYSAQNDWVFFAVTFDARPSSNEVQFYVGSPTADVTSAGQASINSTNSSDTVTAALTIGERFDGLLDNMRLFTARKDITWIDEDGTSYTRNGNNHDFGLLSLQELQTLRAFDLGINQWNVDASGLWSHSSNWVPDSPNGVDASVNFTKPVTAQRTVVVDQPVTVGQIRFGTGSYSIAGATITMQSSTGISSITLGATAQSIVAPLDLANHATFSGSGTLTIDSVYSASGVNLTVAAGTFVKMLDAAPLTSRVGGLVIAGGATPTATVDLANNDLILTSTAMPLVEAQVVYARNSGAWNRAGLTSSAAKDHSQHITTLGVLSGAEYRSIYGSTANFDGFLVADSDVLIKYTYYGDSDFNGVVNFDDYSRIDGGFNSGRSGWINGDFDLNGTVNFDDYALIDLAFNAQAGTLQRALSYLEGDDRTSSCMDEPSLRLVQQHFLQFGESYAIGFISAVPEPSSLVPTVTVAWVGVGRRRRRTTRMLLPRQ